jgi:hypothetical protein
MADTHAVPGTDTPTAVDAARQELLDRLLVERFTTYPRKRVRAASRPSHASEPSRTGGAHPGPRRAR